MPSLATELSECVLYSSEVMKYNTGILHSVHTMYTAQLYSFSETSVGGTRSQQYKQQAVAELGQAQLRKEPGFTLIKVCCIVDYKLPLHIT